MPTGCQSVIVLARTKGVKSSSEGEVGLVGDGRGGWARATMMEDKGAVEQMRWPSFCAATIIAKSMSPPVPE